MLILRRKEGQWIEITHRSGDTIRVRVANIRARYPGQLDLVLDDPERHFVIQRAERGRRTPEHVPVTGETAPSNPGSTLAEFTTNSGENPSTGIIALSVIETATS
jgi:sRNA-binding carbon storage regulator CsrA